MIQTFIKRWRIALISCCLVLLGGGVVIACFDMEIDEGESSNFAPETFVKKNYMPFFYSSYNYYYEIGFDEDNDTRFNEQNVEAWSDYLGRNFNSKALDFLLNKASAKQIKAAEGFYTANNNLPDELKPYAAAFDKNNNKQKVFLKYLRIAKSCESFATNFGTGDWRYDKEIEQKQKEDRQFNTAITSAVLEKAINDEKEPFIKQRYWFQLIRYNFFNNLPGTITAFENTKSLYEQNTMYYRAMAYAAGAYYKQKNYAIANYYYSLAFANSDELKTVAHWSFHPQEEADWAQTLVLCKNDKERITLWQMLGIFYGDEMRSMKEIYRISPSDASIDLLLTRLINKIETDDNTTDSTIKEDFNWCKQIAAENKISNPFLWNISTGYLAFLNNDYNTAKKYYDVASKHLPNTSLAKNQLRLLTLLNKVESIKTITANEEQTLLPEFTWLIQLASENNVDTHFRYNHAIETIKASMANKYKAQGDLVKSECFVSTSAFYLNDKNVNELKAFFSKNDASKFDVLCQSFSEKTLSDLLEYQSVRATFNDNLEDAISFMDEAGKSNETVLAGNPFNGKIKDCHDCDHAQKQSVKYNKLSFLQKMKELKDNVVAKKDAYNNALLLANGYYNITHFGNARYFYEGAILGSEHGEPEMIDSVFRQLLTDVSLANKYYKIALENATDDEQKAKCLYMLSKCERNEWYKKTFFNYSNTWEYKDNKDIDFITWNSFNALRKYKNTQYYKDVIKECGYFKTAMMR